MAATYHLTVVTPERVLFDGEAQNLIVRTVGGEVGILAHHAPYVAPLDVGRMKIVDGEGGEHIAAIAGGLLKTDPESTTILADTCEWAGEIDVERARRAEERARAYIENPTELHTQEIAEIKLRRALNRIQIGSSK